MKGSCGSYLSKLEGNQLVWV